MRSAGALVTVFPTRGGPKKKQRKELAAFRPRPDQHDYLLKAEKRGYGKTEVLIKMMDQFIDLEKELGDTYRDVEGVAAFEGVSPGTVIGRLVKQHIGELRERLAKKP